MSVPRLVVCGLEPGPSVALAAGALQACFAGHDMVRAITVGADLPLWRILYAGEGSAPRVLDPALHDAAVPELYDYWS